MEKAKMLLAVGLLLCGATASAQIFKVDKGEEKSLVCKGGPGQTLMIEKDLYNKTAVIDFFSYRVHQQHKATYVNDVSNTESVIQIVSTHQPASILLTKTFTPKVCRAIECGQHKKITALYKSGSYEVKFNCH